MYIYSDGCIDNGELFDVAVLRGRVIEYDPCDCAIVISKNGEDRVITYEQFDALYYVVNEVSDAALKEDCIFYKVVDGDVLLKNHRGAEKLISMDVFLSMYTI